MFLYYWSIDWYIYLLFYSVFYFSIEFVLLKAFFLKYAAILSMKTNLMFRNVYLILHYTGITCNHVLGSLLIYLYMFLMFMLLYTYGWAFMYNFCQMIMNNISWYYMLFISFLFYFILGSFKDNFSFYLDLFDMKFALIISIILTNLYFFLNSFFSLFFLMECQGMMIMYMLFVIQSNFNLYKMLDFTNMYKYIRNFQVGQLNSMFIQFWVAFMTAVFFIMFCVRNSCILGTGMWADMSYLSYFYIINLLFARSIHYMFLGIMFISILFIKLGLFPFHFWKPILYRGITMWAMMLYMILFTFIFISMFSYIIMFVLDNFLWYWYLFMYILLLLGIMVLINMMMAIAEFSMFLAYMSVFHMSYMFFFFLVFKYTAYLFLIHYLTMYMFIILFLFFMLLLFNNFDLKFLTDFQQLFSYPFWSIYFLMVLIIMGGMPPLIGFWAKLSVILFLASMNELFLIFFVAGSSFFLIFFYLYSYSFFSNFSFNWGNALMNISQSTMLVYMYIYMVSIYSVFYMFFLIDFFSWSSLMNFMTVYYDNI